MTSIKTTVFRLKSTRSPARHRTHNVREPMHALWQKAKPCKTQIYPITPKTVSFNVAKPILDPSGSVGSTAMMRANAVCGEQRACNKKPPFALLFYASSSLLICFLMEHPKGKRRKMQETCRHFDDTSLINPVLTASKRRCGIRRAPLPATLAQDPVASLIAVAFHPLPSRFIPLFYLLF